MNSDPQHSPDSAGSPRRARALLVATLAVAGVMRLWNLSNVPPGLYCDEAALGVNAAFLAASGRSLKGDFLPLYVHEATFERYGSPKIVYQPIYQYTLVPLVGLFGLSTFIVRLPSVIYGLLGILAAFQLARRMIGERGAAATAILLAISPWHHQFSRISFEVISMTPLICWGVLLLIDGLERPRRLVGGMSLLSLATYAYPAARMFVPLLAAGFFVWNRASLRASWRWSVVALAAAVLIGLPNLLLLLTDPNQGRMQMLFVWSAKIDEEPSVRFLAGLKGGWSWARAVLEDRRLLAPFMVLYNWVAHLSPDFLFLHGDSNARQAVRGMGMCHLFTLPLLVAGLATLVARRKEGQNRLLLWWFLIWALPASLTVQAPHATRGFTVFPVLEVIMAAGLFRLLDATGFPRFRAREAAWRSGMAYLALWFAAVRLPIDTVSFLAKYHRDYPVYASEAWDFGVREAYREAAGLRKPGETVIASTGVHNAWLNTLFWVPSDVSALARGRLGSEVPLPPGTAVARPAGAGGERARPGVWILRAAEMKHFPSAEVLARVPFPDGDPNLLVVRVVP